MTLYSEPTYLHAEPCTAVLSDTRPIELAPSALAALNYALDELLQLWVHASLTPSSSSSASGIPGPIGLNEVLSTERLKAGVIRIVGPATGKNVALEAELAVRELLSSSPAALRSDPALKIAASSSLAQSSAQPTDESSPQQQAEDIFRLLRDWVHDISGLGAAAPAAGPASLTEHLRLTVPVRPPAGARQITFITALYAERCLTHVAEALLRAISNVVSDRDREAGPAFISGQGALATLSDVEAAFAEDVGIWEWYRGMRCRAFVESELSAAGLGAGLKGVKRGQMVSAEGSPRMGGGSPRIGTGAPTRAVPFVLHDDSQTGAAQGRRSSVSSSNAQAAAQAAAAAAVLAAQPPRPSSRASFDSATGSIFGLGRGAASKVNGRPSSVHTNGGTEGGRPSMDDSFEQLMQSGKTMKVSLTPDRLRNPDVRSRNALQKSTSVPSLKSAAVSGPAPVVVTQPTRRFTPRGPVPGQDVIDEDENEDETSTSRRGSRQNESLMDFVNSEQPRPKGALSSVPMRVQDSRASTATHSSNFSNESSSENATATAAIRNASPRTRQKHIRAKDERKDLASERQINHDLADFFSQAPPPPLIPSSPSVVTFADSTTTAQSEDPFLPPKKGRMGGFRSFFGGGGSVSGKRRESVDNASLLSKTSTTNGFGNSNGFRRASLQQQRKSSIGDTSASAAALRAAGFSDAAIRTATYSPPPGLGPSPSVHQQRSPQPQPPVYGDRGAGGQGQAQQGLGIGMAPRPLAKSGKSTNSLATVATATPTATQSQPQSHSAPRQPAIPPALSPEPGEERASPPRQFREAATIGGGGAAVAGAYAPAAVDGARSALTEEPRQYEALPMAQPLSREKPITTPSSAPPAEASPESPIVSGPPPVLAPLASSPATAASPPESTEDATSAVGLVPPRPRKSSSRRPSSSSASTGGDFEDGDVSTKEETRFQMTPTGKLGPASAAAPMALGGALAPAAAHADVFDEDGDVMDKSATFKMQHTTPYSQQVSSPTPETIEPSTTLYGLRTQMTTAQSVTECIALLDAFVEARLKAAAEMIMTPSESSPMPDYVGHADLATPRGEVPNIKGDTQAREEDGAQAAAAEYFLEGNQAAVTGMSV